MFPLLTADMVEPTLMKSVIEIEHRMLQNQPKLRTFAAFDSPISLTMTEPDDILLPRLFDVPPPAFDLRRKYNRNTVRRLIL